MDVVHPDSLEIVALNQAAISIAKQLSDKENFFDAPIEVRIKAYELAVQREQARMYAEVADSVSRLAEALKDFKDN